jgi:hypothetical protein
VINVPTPIPASATSEALPGTPSEMCVMRTARANVMGLAAAEAAELPSAAQATNPTRHILMFEHPFDIGHP